MRLVAHRQEGDEELADHNSNNRPTISTVEESDVSLKKESHPSASSPESNHEKSGIEDNEDSQGKDESEIKSPIPSYTSSPRKLDRQGSIERNQSSSTSESFSAQIPSAQVTKMTFERADTLPSESSPLSSSITLPSSPKLVSDSIVRSVVVDPPSTFADEPTTNQDIYFPYLSKVRGIERDGVGVQETPYKPLRFDEPTRDPFSLPSRSGELHVSIEHHSDPFAFSPGNISVVDPSPKPREDLMKAPTREYKSSLLLRHGYTPYRDRTVDTLISQSNKENKVENQPIIVRAGHATPAAEPIIVAEYFVPLCDVSLEI